MGPAADDGFVGSVPLRLADADKALEAAPNDIEIGAIQLRGWQLHRLEPMPPDFSDHAGYLVRINYEFDVAVDVPPPAWVEVAFRFADGVSVVDAVPRTIYTPQDYRSYAITQHLNFTSAGANGWWPADSLAADVALPPVWPRIDCFGLGGSEVKWRHSKSAHAELPPGSQTAWFVLLAPPASTEVAVLASGLYWLDVDRSLGLVPTSRHEAFTVRLPGPPATARQLSPGTADRRGRPRVFISYSQEHGHPDGAAHRANVARLRQLLEEHGIDVLIDQVDLDRRRNWLDWTNAAILRSDFVIVVGSPAYLAASENRLPPGQNLGVRSEYLRLADLLHHQEEVWLKKILPVVLPGRRVEEIPLVFLPHIADHYVIKEFTYAGAEELLQVILRGRA
ncbi:MAG: toll/interleukin-1 receptor domain-containing protein [Micromonosporaceae bacterium]|nr:toll/interleukin-1 receptor domain-containing protein [Micromonosporaceae bacterium]